MVNRSIMTMNSGSYSRKKVGSTAINEIIVPYILANKDNPKFLKKLQNDLLKLGALVEKLISDNDSVSTLPNAPSSSVGRPINDLTDSSFTDLLKDSYKHKSAEIVAWIKSSIERLRTNPHLCSHLKGKRRLMAPVTVAIMAGVFIPKATGDNRPAIEGTSIERYFGLQSYSYPKYSLRGNTPKSHFLTLTNELEELLNAN